MTLSALIDQYLGIEALRSADASGAFLEVAQSLVGAGLAPASSAAAMRDAFLAREKQGSTAFGFGMALPHIFHPDLTRLQLLLARHSRGFDLGAVDGQPTKVLFCLAGPESDREHYLQVLRFLAQTLRNRDWRRFILSANSTAAIADVLREAAPSGS